MKKVYNKKVIEKPKLKINTKFNEKTLKINFD